MSDKHALEAMNFGEQYPIPCIRTQDLNWIAQTEWLPIIGPLHEDAEFLHFPVEHYHIDFRFVDPTSFAALSARYASDGILSNLLGLIVGKEQILEGPVLRQLPLQRAMPLYPVHSREGEPLPQFCALEAAFADWVIDPKRAICPHRGLPLYGLADEDGIAVCPGHGLAWDMRSGKCVRRFSRP